MKRLLCLLITFATFSFSATAQQDWSKLSASQKIKLAKKEQKAAKKDPTYLALMDEALALFQSGKYDEAKSAYEKAHELRPDNVYPMVMLDDIEIAMTLPQVEPEIEEAEAEIIAEEIAIEVLEEEIIEEEIEIIEEEILAEELMIEEAEVDSEIVIAERAEPLKSPVATKKTEKVIVNHPAKVYEEDGVYKENFKEGSANVEQITIVEKGASTIYRKVSHSWGAVYYFENGNAIFKTEWEKMLADLPKD